MQRQLTKTRYDDSNFDEPAVKPAGAESLVAMADQLKQHFADPGQATIGDVAKLLQRLHAELELARHLPAPGPSSDDSSGSAAFDFLEDSAEFGVDAQDIDALADILRA